MKILIRGWSLTGKNILSPRSPGGGVVWVPGTGLRQKREMPTPGRVCEGHPGRDLKLAGTSPQIAVFFTGLSKIVACFLCCLVCVFSGI